MIDPTPIIPLLRWAIEQQRKFDASVENIKTILKGKNLDVFGDVVRLMATQPADVYIDDEQLRDVWYQVHSGKMAAHPSSSYSDDEKAWRQACIRRVL
jgi:hypothetical protein